MSTFPFALAKTPIGRSFPTVKLTTRRVVHPYFRVVLFSEAGVSPQAFKRATAHHLVVEHGSFVTDDPTEAKLFSGVEIGTVASRVGGRHLIDSRSDRLGQT